MSSEDVPEMQRSSLRKPERVCSKGTYALAKAPSGPRNRAGRTRQEACGSSCNGSSQNRRETYFLVNVRGN